MSGIVYFTNWNGCITILKAKNKRTKEQKDNPYNATPLKVLLVVYMNVVNSRTKEKKGGESVKGSSLYLQYACVYEYVCL